MIYEQASVRFQIYGAICFGFFFLSIFAFYTGHNVCEAIFFVLGAAFFVPAYRYICLREDIERANQTGVTL